jgi:hypothetical protein
MDVRSTADYNNLISDIERYAFKDSLNDPHLIRQQHWHIGGSSEERNVANDEEADLITLTPIMANVENNGWYWASDFQSEWNYHEDTRFSSTETLHCQTCRKICQREPRSAVTCASRDVC